MSKPGHSLTPEFVAVYFDNKRILSGFESKLPAGCYDLCSQYAQRRHLFFDPSDHAVMHDWSVLFS